jgi:glycosyltransferase involved in cell wall biosynthesis
VSAVESSVRAPAPSGAVSRPPRRVLHVFHSLGIGGAETWLMSLLEWFRNPPYVLRDNVKIDVLLTGGERAELDDRAIELGATLHYLKYDRHHLASFVRGFRKLLANGYYEAIHDHADYAAGLHLLMGVGQLPPARVVHIHNPYATFERSTSREVVRSFERAAVANLATTVAGTSLQILTDYDLAPSDAPSGQRRLAIHCGFDVERYAGDREDARAAVRREFSWGDDTRILLFVGRLESHFNQKNPAFAVAVARECIARDSRVRALFVGAGDAARAAFEAEAAKSGVADLIRFAGVRSDVPRLMIASELLLFPSIAEGLGMVAVEAQAAGLRVLASDTIPRECAVVPGMVTFAPLSQAHSAWADRAMALLALPAPDAAASRALVRDSAFSIDSSARALLEAYGFERGS